MSDTKLELIGKLVVSALVCGFGGVSLWLTHGESGAGWAILGLIVIWN
jgi:hypothetical protein